MPSPVEVTASPAVIEIAVATFNVGLRPFVGASVALNASEVSPEQADFDDEAADALEPLPFHYAIPIERQLLALPSNLSLLPDQNPAIQLEIQLQAARASRCIMRIRDIVTDKSFNYIHILRAASTTEMTLQSRDQLKQLNDRMSQEWKAYTLCRDALICLRASPAILERFKLLSCNDILASTTIELPNLPGASTVCLSWIWQFEADGEVPTGPNECK